ncbi:MAG TPA: chromosomal replication initiator protein DnaA [Actinomycetota bacterium]
MQAEAKEIWSTTIDSLREEIGAGARAWVESVKPLDLTGDVMLVAAGSPFAREWLTKRHRPTLERALTRSAGRPVTLEVLVDPSTDPAPQPGPEPSAEAAVLAEQPARPVPSAPQPALIQKYTFDNFVIGASNRFPHAAALAVSEQPARSYNPLFIYGDAGLGKTHLLHAIGHEVRRLYPHASVRYVSSEQFMNEFILGVREERMPLFRKRYRESDVLLVDDIQFMSGGERTQEEFFHTFNALYNDGRQIVISSDRPPAQIATLEERLRTRFEMGLITDVQPPDLETRLAILQKKAAAEGLSVPDDVLGYIASRVHNNIRELEGRLIRVVAKASLLNCDITLSLAEEVLKPLLPNEQPGGIPPDLIISECADYFSFPRADLVGPSRSRSLVAARQVAMYLCRELTPLSLPKIGSVFGGRDHTTVMHADSKIRKQMGERHQVYEQVNELTQRIQAKGAAGA